MAADPRPPTPAAAPVTAGGVAFAAVEAELFDADAVPFTTGDIRTVGEMLADVDHQARLLLLDVDGDNAGGLVRGWPALVTAASELWTALPRTSYTDELHDRPMERLVAHAATIDNSLSAGWPGRGDPDHRVAHMTETLQAAGSLVRRYGPEIYGHGPALRQDLQAARSRTMHSLYVAAHAGSVALHAHGYDRYREARQAGRKVSLSTVHSPYVVAPTATWVGRFATAEAIAGRYLAGGLVAGVAGEARPSATDHHRVPRALAGWDIQAHRTLAARSSAADNVTVSRTQALIAGVGLLLVDADSHHRTATTAAAGGHPPSDRLTSPLDAVGRAWNNLASRWDDLPAPTDRPDPKLLRASAELRAAYRELTHDATTTFPPDVIAQYPGLERALNATLAAIESSPELADVLAEKANQPGLVGRARALSHRAHNDIEAGLATPDPSGDVVWVSPADIHAKRLVLLPPPVAETLRAASDAMIDATSSVSAVATVHQREHTAATPDVDPGLRGKTLPEVGRPPIATSTGPRR
ncbi:hypothetical protein [Nocardioides sp.]|uniref:hypothetical protein n=1 Tax=Nocardioides sp. TaxID=35761 RepID=UPI003D0F2AFB